MSLDGEGGVTVYTEVSSKGEASALYGEELAA